MSAEPRDGARPRGSVPNVFVRGLFDYLEKHGKDARAVLGEPAPEPGELGELRYPIARWAELLARAAKELSDPLLGLHLGGSLSARHGGMLSYLLLSCRTVSDVFAHYARYEPLFYDARLARFYSDDTSTHVEWSGKRGKPGALVDECAISGFVRFVRGIVREPVPLEEVCFEHPKPRDLRPYEQHFGCVVRFAQPSTRLRWPLRLLDAPVRSKDPVLLRVMEERAESLLAHRPTDGELEKAVRNAITRQLRESGEPTLERVADEVGLSSRTLRRKLEARGKSFRTQLDEVRCRLAKQYLREGRIELSDIAQRLGFSEQSAFNRSFKRWTGETPRRFREQARGNAS